MQTHITGRGWDKLDPAAAAVEAAKSHAAAQKLIGVPPESVVKLPKDATDPSYQGILDRVLGMSTPKTPEEYTFDGIKFKDGRDLDEDNVKFMREVAAKYKLPISAARGIAADLAAKVEDTGQNDAAAIETTKAANQVALRTAWGGTYDQNAFSATRAAEGVGFTPEVLAAMATLPAEKYVANMNALLKLSSQLNEATILRGGAPVRDPTAGFSADQARARLDQLKEDRVWGQKFLAGDADATAEFQKLTRIMVGAPPV